MPAETASQTTEPKPDQGGLLRGHYLGSFPISSLIVFFELAFTRWFASSVIFLTFFTNLAHMACLLRVSAGLVSAGRRRRPKAWVIRLALPITGMAVVALGAAFYRAGVGASAVASLDLANALGGCTAVDNVFLAMAHARLGNLDGARTAPA